MILLIVFMCGLAISAYVGVRSSRSHRNVDWVSVFLAVLIFAILILLTGFVLQSWIDWKSTDNRQHSLITSGRVTNISKDVDYDVYEVDYGNGSTGRVLRFSFRLDWFEGLSIAMIGGIFSGTLAVGIKRAMTKRSSMQQHEKCLHCGYNLTGNTTGICPECGKPVPPTIPDPSMT